MPAWDMISPPEENLSYVPAFRAMCVRSNHWQLYTKVLVGVGVKSAGVTGATRQPKPHELTDSDSKLARPRPRYCIFLQACTPSPFFDATQQCTWSKVLSWSALPLCRHPFLDSASFPQSFLAMSGWRRPGAPFGSFFLEASCWIWDQRVRFFTLSGQGEGGLQALRRLIAASEAGAVEEALVLCTIEFHSS